MCGCGFNQACSISDMLTLCVWYSVLDVKIANFTFICSALLFNVEYANISNCSMGYISSHSMDMGWIWPLSYKTLMLLAELELH